MPPQTQAVTIATAAADQVNTCLVVYAFAVGELRGSLMISRIAALLLGLCAAFSAKELRCVIELSDARVILGD